ncbi:hypothetical protein HDU83_001218 [Entophlyctis luteolus]|nr:hypothetical protein HDU83_001218 [Entophlyctis luteolus]KAJ3395026.1 hypothetical protein HDU84_004484 [Entophlyctis sp. JEL0112]
MASAVRALPSATHPTFLPQSIPSSAPVESVSPLPLQHSWVFWTMQKEPKKRPVPQNTGQSDADTGAVAATDAAPNINYHVNYSDAITKLCSFSTVEEFWAGYSHLKRPHDLPLSTDLFLFKEGLRPTWEGVGNFNQLLLP